MKNALLLISGIVLLAFGGCNQTVKLETEKADVKIVIDEFKTFWETEDMNLFSKIIAHDTDMVNYGSDAGEYFVGWNELKEAAESMLPYLDKTNITVKDQVIKIHSSGDVAWFSEVWDWDLLFDGQPLQLPGQRLTGVLEKRNGSWVIVQFHNSVPVTGS